MKVMTHGKRHLSYRVCATISTQMIPMVNYLSRRDNLTWQERQQQMRWTVNRNFELDRFVTRPDITDKLLILMSQFDKSPLYAGCWFSRNLSFDKIKSKLVRKKTRINLCVVRLRQTTRRTVTARSVCTLQISLQFLYG